MKEININDLKLNPFNKIGKEWMLITASDGEKTNTMTASWGGFGFLWNKNIAFIVLRPQRYTKEFVDKTNEFSLSFFDESYKKTLSYLGSVSGKNEDKILKSCLHLSFINNIPSFEEASMIINCKNLYKQNLLSECFIDTNIDEKNYPNKDYHTLYFAEIKNIFVK